jgi:2-C-methyl-D-erythritol 4-phosphate cytidylyltransferase
VPFRDIITIILAGNDEDATLLGGIGQPSKFFLPFGGERVGDRILRSIDDLDFCKAIYVAIPDSQVEEAEMTARHPIHHVAQGLTQIQSMFKAVEEAERLGDYQPGDFVLVISGDLPLLSAQALENLIAACAKEERADCYLAMIPFSEVPSEVQKGYEIEVMSFRSEECLHSDVWLLRPDSLTEAGRKRMDKILRIRRLKRDSIGDMLRVGILLLSIVGPQSIPGFVRTVLSMRRSGKRDDGAPREALDAVEKMAIELIEARFGPRMCLVRVCEAALALGIDRNEQLALLLDYATAGGNP